MAEPGISPRIIRFGAFEIDLASAELRKHGLRLRIQEQPFQILVALLERPGEVVTRDDLHRRLWPDHTFVDFEHGLNAAVTRLRQTLGDSAQTPRFVESVPRRGYRFIGPVGPPAREMDLLPEQNGTQVMPSRLGASPRQRKWRVHGRWLVAMVFVVSACVFLLEYRQLPKDARPITFTLLPPEKTTFGQFDTLAVSPDGRMFAFTASDAAGETHLWVRPLDATESRRLDGTQSASFPFWSADSRSIGFFVRGKLKRIDPSGWHTTTICDAPSGRGGTWSESGLIVFAPEPNSPLFQVSSAGGDPKPATRLDGSRREISHRWPSFLPGGRRVLYTARSSSNETSGIFVRSLDSQRVTRVLPDLSNAQYVTTLGSGGNLLFARGEALLSQRFDPGELKVIGEPVQIAQHINRSQNVEPIHAKFSASSASGSAAVVSYIWGRGADQLTWFDRNGIHLQSVGEPGTHLVPSLSPDGKDLAVDRLDMHINTFDLWRIDLARNIPSRLTFDPQNENQPVWSPDGAKIAFASNALGAFDLYRKLSSGAGETELLLKSDRWKFPTSWSPDGRFLLYNEVAPDKYRHIWAVSLSGDKKPVPLRQAPFNDADAVFSPDGKWLAFSSDESGKQEIYVQPFSPFSPPGKKWMVSSVGGYGARWPRDGTELFYLAPGHKLMAVPVTTGNSFQAGLPRLLFESGIVDDFRARFVVADRGRRFLLPIAVSQRDASTATIIVN